MPQHRPLCATTRAPSCCHHPVSCTRLPRGPVGSCEMVQGSSLSLCPISQVQSPCHLVSQQPHLVCPSQGLFLCHTETVEFSIISGIWHPPSPVLWSSLYQLLSASRAVYPLLLLMLLQIWVLQSLIANRSFVWKGMLNVLNWKYKWGLLLHCIICKTSIADTGGCSSAWPVLRNTSVSQLWCPGSLLHCGECIPWTNYFLKKIHLFYMYAWIPEWICTPCECRYP